MQDKKATSEAKKTKAINWHQNPVFYFISGGIILVLIGGFLAIPEYNDFVEKKADLKRIVIEIKGDPANNQFVGKESELQKLQAQYVDKKRIVDKENAEKQAILDKTFPDKEQINYLTDLLESYAIEHDSPQEPFELTNIAFAKPKVPTVAKGETPKPPTPVGFMEMQINLPLKLSKNNFTEFINFIEKSGSLDSEDFYGKEKEVPLMTIESLDFNYFENPDRPSQQLVDANFVLNTYINLSNNTDVSTTK